MIKLWNTARRTLETFTPTDPTMVKVYLCGPTVYDYTHLGNTRAAILGDLVHRVLLANGYQVRFISNFTDIDDKIAEKARVSGKTASEITTFYRQAYLQDMEALNVLPLAHRPLVTEYLPKIISLIEEMLEGGVAYHGSHGIYFRVATLAKYPQLSNQARANLLAGARVALDEEKEDPLDFALWKKVDDACSFASPWGKGRPGWHSECVAMIWGEFNDLPIDLHIGGADLIFPHHENELAQAVALGQPLLAHYWLHNQMLNLGDGKMSKSLGNVWWTKDLLVTYGANTLRYFLLNAPYQKPLTLSEQALLESQQEVEKLLKTYYRVLAQVQVHQLEIPSSDRLWYPQFLEAINHNFNVQNAMTVVFQWQKQANQALRGQATDLGKYVVAFQAFNQILGLHLEQLEITTVDRTRYQEFQTALATRNYPEADRLRDSLAKKYLC